MVGGAVGGALCLGLLSIADTVAVMLLGWCGVQAFLNAMFAAVMASIPDQVPVDRRGLIGGMVAIAQTIGIVAGVGIASATGSIAAGYLATTSGSSCWPSPTPSARATSRCPRGSGPSRSSSAGSSASFWISPRQHPDFAWAWITRFLVNLGNSLGTLYLLYYVTDGLGFSDDEADDRVFVLTALYAVATVADDRGVRPLERPARAAQDLRDLVRAWSPGWRRWCSRSRRPGRPRWPPRWCWAAPTASTPRSTSR